MHREYFYGEQSQQKSWKEQKTARMYRKANSIENKATKRHIKSRSIKNVISPEVNGI